MKKLVVSLAGVAAALLVVLGLVGCVMPDQPADTPPEGTYSTNDLLANLEQLQGPASRSLSIAGKTIFSLPGGGTLGTQDLSAYLSAIKKNFASYVSSSTSGSPYLVTAVKLSWPGSNSGLMWVPFTWFRSAKFPVISYQHGTQVYRSIAPSRFNVNPLAVFSSPDPSGALQNYVECVVGALMASAGYIVVMPDYQGFGDSTVIHPYVTLTLGDSVTGILAAAQAALSRSLVRPAPKVFLTGYSEGGYATMAGARALHGMVTATVPCDGAYDLSGTMLEQMTSGAPVLVPWYLLYTASGYRAAYGLDLTGVFQPPPAPWIADLALFDGNHTNAEISAAVPPGISPSIMLTSAALAALKAGTGDVYNKLAENDAWMDWTPMSPLYLVHSPDDDVVPIGNATAVLNHYSPPGSPPNPWVSLKEVPFVPFIDTLLGSKHVAAYPTAMLAAFTAIQTINNMP